jgi:hypothetical protein
LVGINEGLISTDVAPFGGIKESGLGREGRPVCCRQGLHGTRSLRAKHLREPEGEGRDRGSLAQSKTSGAAGINTIPFYDAVVAAVR